MSNDEPGDEGLAPLDEDLAALGRLGRPHGVCGELRCKPFAEDFGWYFDLKPDRIFLLRKGHPPQRARATFRGSPGGVLFAALQGVQTREKAQEFTGCILAIPESDRPALDGETFYVDEFKGLEVLGPDGELIGRIEEILESADQSFLSVRGEGGGFLLRPDQGLIESVDWKARQIRLRIKISLRA